MRRAELRGGRWLAVAVALLSCAACIDTSRVNYTCTWSDRDSTHLDLAKSSDRDHLRQDAQLAWELAVRYGDALEGVVSFQARPRQRECRVALRDTIVARHGVTQADVRNAWMWRVWWIDVVIVFLPMMLLTVVAASSASRFAARHIRILPDTVPRTLLLSGLTALIMSGLAQYWAMTVETLRLRNWHLSDRVSSLPHTHHPVLAIGVLFVICVLAASRASASKVHPQPLEGA